MEMDISSEFERISLNSGFEATIMSERNDKNSNQKGDKINDETNNTIDLDNDSNETIVNHRRKKRFICRFCPQPPSKYCYKHKLSRIKGTAFKCNFCSEYFEYKTFLAAHVQASHSKLVAIERIAKKAIKGVLPNIQKFQNVLSKYANIR